MSVLVSKKVLYYYYFLLINNAYTVFLESCDTICIHIGQLPVDITNNTMNSYHRRN